MSESHEADCWQKQQKFHAETAERWTALKNRLQIGQVVEGVVQHREPFGIFVDLGEDFVGLVEVVCLPFPPGKAIDVDDYPEVGETVQARVLQFVDSNRQIRLTMRDVPPAQCDAVTSSIRSVCGGPLRKCLTGTEGSRRLRAGRKAPFINTVPGRQIPHTTLPISRPTCRLA